MISKTTVDYVLIPFLFHFSSYWIAVSVTYVLDLLRLPSDHINWKRYGSAVKVSLRNQFLVGLPTLYIFRDGIEASVLSTETNSYLFQVLKLVLLVHSANLFFYWTHRLLHLSFMFRYIHAQHHEFTEPIGVAAMYSHPLEHLISNTLSFILPFLYIGASYRAMLVLLSFASCTTVLYHTRSFVFFEDHLIHHQRFKTNFGFGRYLDNLFGTSSSKEERVSVSTSSSKDNL
jgi:methylsterol monooxygenase